MKNILVMGIGGSFGGEVAQALSKPQYQHQFSVSAMARKPATAAQDCIPQVQGDVSDIESVRRACKDMDIIIYGVNPANYRWQNTAVPWLENVLTVAEEQQITIVFPGNVYVFDPAMGPDFDELAAHRPVSWLGEIRQQMEARLKLASERGVKVIIMRMGDFIAKDAKSAWLQQLIKTTKSGTTLLSPGNPKIKHTWAYVPDVAHQIAEILTQIDDMPVFTTFHHAGYRVSIYEMAQTIEEATGRPVKIGAFPWWMFRLLSPFHVLFRGLRAMRYLWEVELNLLDRNSECYLLRQVENTPLAMALLQTGLIMGKPVES